jgi:hypothetical protein
MGLEIQVLTYRRTNAGWYAEEAGLTQRWAE